MWHPDLTNAERPLYQALVRTLERDIAEAQRLYAPGAPWTPASLAAYIEAVLQGAFVLAKARGGPEPAALCLEHLSRSLEGLFSPE